MTVTLVKVSELQEYDIERYGSGKIGGEAVNAKVDSLNPLYFEGKVSSPDPIFRHEYRHLITTIYNKMDLIIALGVAELLNLEAQEGVFSVE